jgi:hypothetical protein
MNERTNERTNVTGETLAEELDFVDGCGDDDPSGKGESEPGPKKAEFL